MFLVLILCLGLLALLVWAGRRPASASQAVRLGSGVFAVLVAVGAVVSGLRGAWMVSLGLVVLSGYLAQRARMASPRRFVPPGPGLGRQEACAILGVENNAGRAEIQAAYRRLIAFAHPDKGGSAGLAAQLNAARDRLLKE